MRTKSLFSVGVGLILAMLLSMACNSKKPESKEVKVPGYLSARAELYETNPRQANLEWFKDAKFGLFMHYGLYSILEDGEWIQLRHDPPIPVSEYDTLKNVFTAEHFDADFITDLALDGRDEIHQYHQQTSRQF
jgi:alpha-L-fucosidase